MFAENYRSMNEQITPSQELVNKVIKSINKSPQKTKMIFRNPVIIAAMVIICIFTAIPALAANIPFINQLMYQVSPSIAQFFTPIKLSCEDNGVKMEVVSTYIHDGTAEIYITMQDLTGNRIDETTDLFDSYSINRSFSSEATCMYVGYEEDTKTATFLITITEYGGHKIKGNKITFSVREFISDKKVYGDKYIFDDRYVIEGIPLNINLSNISDTPSTMPMLMKYGGGGSGNYDLFKNNPIVLVPSESINFSVDGIDISGIGYIDGMLHIQTFIENYSKNDNHGYFYFKNNEGEIIHDIYNVGFNEYINGERVRYEEYVFDIPQLELENYKIYGYFVTSNSFTQGNWKVTFPLKNSN